MPGPLTDIRVVEFSAAGPVPFCGMVLADLGADVVRVDRLHEDPVFGVTRARILGRGRRSIAVDLARAEGVACALDLAARSDILLEGWRPGVAERLGIGPDACLGRNPALVYGRGTGWGQQGRLRDSPGHDIDYIAVSGALHGIGRADDKPVPPLSLVGDFGGGGMLLAVGVLAALSAARRDGRGQVVDAAMVDGAALLTTTFHELLAAGLWTDQRGANLVDGGTPFYDTYETADGKYVAIGAMEPKFFHALAEVIGLTDDERGWYTDRTKWEDLRERLGGIFRSRTREEWCAMAAGTEACIAPVLSMSEAPTHPFNAERSTFVDVDGAMLPAPAPRFSGTPTGNPVPAPAPGAHTDAVLEELGHSAADIRKLREIGVVG